MWVLSTVAMGLLALACSGPDCPASYTRDDARTRGLEALVGASDALICFGAVPDRGVKDDAGRFLLERTADDRLLGARLVHLRHHGATPHGDNCLRQLAREEALAWAAELQTRARLAVSDPSCPAERALGERPDPTELEAWITSSDDPVPAARRASHRRRCGW